MSYVKQVHYNKYVRCHITSYILVCRGREAVKVGRKLNQIPVGKEHRITGYLRSQALRLQLLRTDNEREESDPQKLQP